jgi:antitoxin component of MazEF toxin-antitoxin module
MKARIIQIGNVRIPKRLLEKAHLTEDVQIEAMGSAIVIQSERPRAGWDTQFRPMAQRGDDQLLDEIVSSLKK